MGSKSHQVCSVGVTWFVRVCMKIGNKCTYDVSRSYDFNLVLGCSR